MRSDRLWHAAVFGADISLVIDDLVACARRVEKGDSLMTAFGDAVEFADYRQKPDNADRALAADAVREALMPVAEAVTRGARRAEVDTADRVHHGRMDVTLARPIANPGVRLLDAQALQGVLDIVGDSRPVGVLHDLGGAGFGQLAQVRPGSEQLIQHGGFLGRGQGVRR